MNMNAKPREQEWKFSRYKEDAVITTYETEFAARLVPNIVTKNRIPEPVHWR